MNIANVELSTIELETIKRLREAVRLAGYPRVFGVTREDLQVIDEVYERARDQEVRLAVESGRPIENEIWVGEHGGLMFKGCELVIDHESHPNAYVETQRTADGRAIEPCTVCGKPLAVGEQGCITTIRPHEPVLTYHPFIPYFDVGLGVQVNSHAERWKHMRNQKMDYRDKMRPGELSARRDRIEDRKREERRG